MLLLLYYSTLLYSTVGPGSLDQLLHSLSASPVPTGSARSQPGIAARVIPKGPWDSVYVDGIGPLPASKGGHRYVRVAIVAG